MTYWCPRCQGGDRPARRVTALCGVACAHRTSTSRCARFCLAAFAAERGAQVPFAFEEHTTREGPSLYEYRPLVRGFVEEQAPTLRRLPDARNAIDDLRREPAAAIFARAHAGRRRDERRRALPLDPPADADVDRRALRRLRLARRRVRRARTRISSRRSSARARTYVALAPVVGLSAGDDADLGGGITLRPAVAGEISQLWPEAHGLMPPEFGRDIDRLLVLELRARARARRGRAAGRGRRARRRGHRAPARDRRRDRRRPGRLRAARLPAPARLAAAADRGDAAARRARRASTRFAARLAADLRERLDARRRGPRARRGARPLGALALRRGAVPLGAGARGARVPARRRGRRLGRGAARGRAARREDAGARRAARGAARRAARSRLHATRSGARSSRRSCTARASSWSRRSTRHCSGCGRGRESVLRVA